MRKAMLLAVCAACFSVVAKQKNTPPATPAQIVERGANYRVWQRIVTATGPNGAVVQKTNSYTELATGLCYPDKKGGWLDADPQIVIQRDGTGVGQGAGHSVRFLPDINSDGSISSSAANKNLRSHVLGICYYDWKNQREAQIGSIKSSIGKVVGKNQLIYADAFNGLKADVRYNFRRAGLGQDIIFREQLPNPADFQMDPATTRVEVWTEFLQPPQSTLRNSHKDRNGQEVDDIIDFDGLKIGRGAAFSTPNQTSKIPVNKQWQQIKGRTFLIESVDLRSIVPATSKLPQRAEAALPKPAARVANAVKERHAPSRIAAVANANQKLQIASASPQEKGFVLDYETVSGDLFFYTLEAGKTYYVSDSWGPEFSLTVEGGAVIKFGPDGSLGAGGSSDTFPGLICNTAPYRPAVFTSQDDDSVGETITGSSGSPTILTNSSALGFGDAGGDAHDLRFSYIGSVLVGATSIQNVQFLHCPYPMLDTWNDVVVKNCLFYDFDTISGGPAYWDDDLQTWMPGGAFYNVTFESGNYIGIGTAVNCIFSDIADTSGVSGGSNNGFYNATGFGDSQFTSSGSPFQTVGGGQFYLAAPEFSAVGTTNLVDGLLPVLQSKVTQPPIVITNDITNQTVFVPQVARDTNSSPDLGYHYDAIDYLVGGINVATNIVLTNGVVFAFHAPSQDSSYIAALSIGSDYSFVSTGSPSKPNQLVWYDTVQETTNAEWSVGAPDMFGAGANGSYSGSYVPTSFDWRFTHLSRLAGSGAFATSDWVAAMKFRDCEFYNGSMYFGEPAWTIGVTNCLFNYCELDFYVDAFETSPVTFLNCSFRQNKLFLDGYNPAYPAFPLGFTNCFFETTNISSYYTPARMTAANNAFLVNDPASIIPTNSHDIALGMFVNWYQNGPFYSYTNGPLGNFYHVATNLIDRGFDTADHLALYQYTTQNDQTIEGRSTTDIGYHYVALDGNGMPIDSDSDGVPDYVADPKGPCAESAFATCTAEPSLSLGFVPSGSWPSYELGDTVSASASVTTNVGSVHIAITYSDCSTDTLDLPTNSFIVTNWWVATVPDASFLASGSGLNASFADSDGPGAGQLIFYLTYSNNLPCTNVVTIALTNNFNVFDCLAPALTQPPTDFAGCDGDTATFSALACGVPSLLYQWSFNGTPIAGATGTSFSTTINSSTVGTYSVTVTNAYGSTTATAQLVDNVPLITGQPISQTVTISNAVDFCVSGAGSVQWYKNGSPITDATNLCFTNAVVQYADAGSYTAVLTGLAPCSSQSVTSSIATLTVMSYPCTNADPSLIAWWRGEDSSDAVHAYDATLNSCCIDNFPAEVGNGFHFNGGAYWINCGTNIGNFGTNDFTIEFWINTASTRQEALMAKRPACDNNDSSFIDIRKNTNGNIHVGLGGASGTGLIGLNTSRKVNDGIAHHYAVVRHATNLLQYVDGALDSATNISQIARINNSTQFKIGYSSCIGYSVPGVPDTHYFTGWLDEISIYSSALDSNAISGIYNAGVNGKCTNIYIAPFIASQPISATVTCGQTAAFNVWAGGTATMSYQWYQNGTAIPGQTSSSLTVDTSGWSGATASYYAIATDSSNNSATSATVTLTVKPSVTLTSNPAVLTNLCDGAVITNTASACGAGTLSYQWQRNGANITGATTSTLIVTNSWTTSGSYSVDVTSSYGSTTASTVLVDQSPIIWEQPESQTVSIGNTAEFTVDGAWTFQWYKNGVAISGATDSTLTIANVQNSDAGTYSAVVGGCSTTISTTNAVLTVQSPSCTGETNGLWAWWAAESNAVDIVGGYNCTTNGTITYTTGKVGSAFYFDGHANYLLCGTNVGNFGTNDFSIAFWIQTTNTQLQEVLSKRPTCDANNSFVDIRMSNGQLHFGVSSANGIHTLACDGVTSVSDGLPHHCVFVRHAGNLTNYIDGAFDTNATMSGAANISNGTQFKIGYSPCIGSDGTHYFDGWLDEIMIYTNALTPTDVQNIYNAGNNGVCPTAFPPNIAVQPYSATANCGTVVTFNVSVGGTAPFTYQWYSNGVSIANATNISYTLTNQPTDLSANYHVVVCNAIGCATSADATLEVLPKITANPTSVTSCTGSTATFCVSACPTWATYQWMNNGSAIAGATQSCYSLTTSPVNGGWYWCAVSSDYGTANSTMALLSDASPFVSSSSSDQTVHLGNAAVFSVNGGPQIQWSKGTNILSTSSTYIIPSVTNADAGTYVAKVYSTICSNDAPLYVTNVLTVVSNTCTYPTNSLVAWWRGEGDFTDFKGGYNGTSVGSTAITFVSEKVGQGFSYDGHSNYIDCGRSIGNFGTNNFTVEFWMSNSTTRHEGILGKRAGCDDTSRLEVDKNSDGTLHIGISGNSSAGSIGIDTAAAVNDGRFHHIAVVRSNTTLTAYIDGVVDSSGTASTVANVTNNAPFRIGYTPCVDFSTMWCFTGYLDEISIYTNAVGPDYIQSVYNSSYLGKCTDVIYPPTISAAPQSKTTSCDTPVTFTVGAGGSLPLSYQWYSNGTVIATATTSSLTVSEHGTNAPATSYTVVVSNGAGSVNASASLALLPSATVSPSSVILCAGQTVTFNNTPCGTPYTNGSVHFNYQWLWNSTNIPNATNATLTRTNFSPGSYQLVIYGQYGAYTSTSSLLTDGAPEILQQPVSQTVTYSNAAYFTLQGYSSIRWRKNGSNIANATNFTYIITNVAFGDAATYDAVVTGLTNCNSSITSAPVTLTVNAAVCSSVTNGMHAWIPFESSSYQDVIGNRTGTVTGANATFVPGKVGTALNLAGGTYVKYADTNLGNFGTNDFTVEFWIKTTSARAECVIGKRVDCTANTALWNVRKGDDGTLHMGLSGNVGNGLLTLSTIHSVTDGIYHHYAVVRHAGNLTNFLDGAMECFTNSATVAKVNTTAVLKIGSGPCDANYYLGALDEITFYTNALTPAQVKSNYDASYLGKCH